MLQANDAAFSKTVGEIEKDRADIKAKFLGFLIAGIVLLLLGIIFGIVFFLTTPDDVTMLILMGVGLVLAFVFVVVALGINSSFQKKARTKMEELVNSALFKVSAIEPRSGFALNELLSTGFFVSPDRYFARNYKRATYNGLPFCQASYELQRREVHQDGKNTRVTYVTYAAGTLYRFDFGRRFENELRVIEKSGLFGGGLYSGGGEKVETEYIAFNKKFNTYSDDRQFVFYILTPQIQEKILGFESFLKGEMDLAFMNGNSLYVAVNDAGESFEVSLFKSFDKAAGERLLRVLAFPSLVVDELGLEGPKFQPNAGTMVTPQ